MSTDAILDRLTKLYPKAIEPGLERTLRILGDLGDPQLKLPPVLHVAGTNGKGSTLAFIRAMLEAAGKTCHVMTSPHLVKFNERLAVAGKEISDDDLLALLTRVEKINAGQSVTFFEITTAAGFLAFAHSRADYTLLETGMGGRLDSTNVVPAPLVTVVTNISFDHMQHLGDTLEKIAHEKAGILKPGVPCVLGPMDRKILPVFEARANDIGAPLYRFGREWDCAETKTGFTVTFAGGKHDCPTPNLLGAHQIVNAATAVAALLAAGIGSPRTEALAHAVWPARLQKIIGGALFDLLPSGFELWLDGGHNRAGGEILGDQAKRWREQDGRPLHLILGMLTTKDPQPFYDSLEPFIASAVAVPIPDEKLAFAPDALADLLGIGEAENIQAALRACGTKDKGRILLTGSLYLAGYFLKLNNLPR